MNDQIKDTLYDVMILGGGPAGLSAAIYARRAHLKTLMIEKGGLGGQISQTAEIENYPGGIKGESGFAFCERLVAQAESFGLEKTSDEIHEVDFSEKIKCLTGAGGVYRGKTVIISTGNVPMTLGVPGEETFAGRGVSYCATCDGPFFTGLEVFVVGGGDSAVEESMHLAKFARNVTIIHRRDTLRAARSIQTKVLETENISLLLDTVVRKLKGTDLLETLVVENVKTGVVREITAKEGDGSLGVFIFVGSMPQTGIFEGKIQLEGGYVVTDEQMRTNIQGVYAAGDVRKKEVRQVVTAAADGAIAAVQAEKYLSFLLDTEM